GGDPGAAAAAATGPAGGRAGGRGARRGNRAGGGAHGAVAGGGRGRPTRARFVPGGILVRRLIGDPQLRGVAAVILDEFHERHLATDLSLALLRALQRGPRPDLRLLVMSATLEAAPG